MVIAAILIPTFILVVFSQSENSKSNISNFNSCYFNVSYAQCSSGEECAIVPPLNSTVRRRMFHRDPFSLEASLFNFGVRRLSSNISRSSFGSTVIGITSSPVSYSNTWFWWNRSPLPYYQYRQSNENVDDLQESQGICISTEELRRMTKHDCYTWCMSYIYDHDTCANDCGLPKIATGSTTTIVSLGITIMLICAGIFCVCRLSERKKRILELVELDLTPTHI